MQPRKTLLLLTFSCFIVLAFSNLNIISPEGLKDWWKKHPKEIDTSLAAFGYVPWGRKIRGQLELADPINACDYIKQGQKEFARHPIIVAKRGDCTFVQKAHYAQLAGASMLLVVDDKYEDVKLHLMVDKTGNEDSVKIPAILVDKTGGDRLIESLKSEDSKISSISVIYDFNLTKTDVVKYNVWLSSANEKSFEFIKQWVKYEKDFGENTQLTPHYAHYKNSDSPSNCLCNGKYCAEDPDEIRENTGADVLLEDLRQVCLFNEYSSDTYISYMLNYDTFCLRQGKMKDCGSMMVKWVGADVERIDRCINGYFDTKNPNNCNSNYYFDQEAIAMAKDGVFYTPYININGMAYRGGLFPVKNVFEAVCESFTKAPGVCHHFLRSVETVTNHSATVGVMLGVLFFVVGVALIIFFFFRRSLKIEMKDRIQKDVSIMLEQYKALRDEKPHDENLETL